MFIIADYCLNLPHATVADAETVVAGRGPVTRNTDSRGKRPLFETCLARVRSRWIRYCTMLHRVCGFRFHVSFVL